MEHRIYDYLLRRAENIEPALTVREIREFIADIQDRAVGHELYDVGHVKWQSAVDDLCRIIICLCDHPEDKAMQPYLTEKLTSVTWALNV